MSDKKLYWYIVYWRNKDFLRSKYHPHKPGFIFGVASAYENNVRLGFDPKKRDFVVVEKLKLLRRCTPEEFKKWITDIKC